MLHWGEIESKYCAQCAKTLDPAGYCLYQQKRKCDRDDCESGRVSYSRFCTVHSDGYIPTMAGGASQIACQYMDDCSTIFFKTPILHRHRVGTVETGKEWRIRGIGKKGYLPVDGWIEKNRFIIEFHGDFWHGNPKRFLSTQWNEYRKCSFGNLYNQTLFRMTQFIQLGYRVFYTWESDYRSWLQDKSQRFPIIEHFVM